MSKRRGLWSRFDSHPGRQQAKPVRNGFIGLAILGVVLYSGFTVSIPFKPESGTIVKAQFDRAANARSGTPVRVFGVTVGEVSDIERAPGGRGVVVSMRIKDGEGVHLHSDARAQIWWRTLLGRNMYVALEPGSASAPALGGATIPQSRTSSQVELDELVSVLDKNGRQSVQTMMREFDRGFSSPRATGATLDALAPAMRSISPALRALRGTQAGDLQQVVAHTSRTFGALARDEQALGGLIDNGATTLGVTAAQRADLGRAIAGAPASLRQTRATMTRLRSTLDVLDPVAKDLRPGARALAGATRAARPAFGALDVLLDRAEPLLYRLRPTSQTLADVAADARPLVRNAKPLVDRAKDEIIPFLNERDPSIKLRNFEAIGPTLSAVASATQPFDINGHVIRFQAGASEQFVGTSPCTTYLLDPTHDQKVDCSMIENALKAALGLAPPPKAKAKRGRGR